MINDCPGVRESAVLGMPDDRRGERVVAAVVRGDPALDERGAAGLSAPSAWSTTSGRPTIVFVDDLPRNAMGKVLRRELAGSTRPVG